MKYFKAYKNFHLLNENEDEKSIVNFDPKARQLINNARVLITANYTFYAELMNKLIFIQTRDVGTMATNGTAIYYNPDFTVYELQTIDQVAFVICHEILHCALGHFARIENKNHNLWNYATDYAINATLMDTTIFHNKTVKMDADKIDKVGLSNYKISKGMMTAPTFILLEEKYAKDGIWSSEAIYADLEKNGIPEKDKPKQQGDGSGKSDQQQGGGGGDKDKDGDQQSGGSSSGSGGSSSSSSSSGNSRPMGDDIKEANESYGGFNDKGQYVEAEDTRSNQTDAEMARNWRSAAEQAARRVASSGSGHVPGNLYEELTSDKKKKSVQWKDLLKRVYGDMVQSVRRKSKRFDRRGIGRGSYVEKRYNEDKELVVIIAVDTSGSVSSDSLEQFLAEMNSIMSESQPDVVWVLDSDTGIERVQKFENPDKIPIKGFHGRGGTDFKPIFDWTNKKIEEGELKNFILIYFTDGQETVPPKPEYDEYVIWAIDNDKVRMPWGTNINVIITPRD